jgi:hypothetical protein
MVYMFDKMANAAGRCSSELICGFRFPTRKSTADKELRFSYTFLRSEEISLEVTPVEVFFSACDKYFYISLDQVVNLF